MKYNDELAFKILLYLEEPPKSARYGDVVIDGFSQEEVSYHIKKLAESDLVVGLDAETFGKMEWKATDLTTSGHKYLEQNRNRIQNYNILQSLKLWLETIYKKLPNGGKVNVRALELELLDELSESFLPTNFAGAFWRVETGITILGIGLIAPESELIKRADKIFQGILNFLKENSNAETISVESISKITELQNNEVAEVFDYFISLGYFEKSNQDNSKIKITDRTVSNAKRIKTIQQLVSENLESRLHKSADLEKITFNKQNPSLILIGDNHSIISSTGLLYQGENMTVFDQRNQRVNTQYNAAGDINFNNIQDSSEFIAELQKLKAEFLKIAEQEAIDGEIVTDAEYQLTKAIQQSQKPEPDKKTIVEHLKTAKQLIEGVVTTTGLVTALSKAAEVAQTIFN